jgi:hypothetical protein
MCEAISDAHLHLWHLGLFTSPSLNGCPLKWQCPVRNPVIILNCFLLRLSNSPAFLAEVFFLRKPLACFCPHMDCQCSSCFLLVQSLITPLATFADIPSAGSGPMSGCEEPCWLTDLLLHFHQSTCVLVPIPVGSQTNLKFIYKLSCALMAVWLSERMQMCLPV